MFQTILYSYGLKENNLSIVPFGSGLINNTWKVLNGNKTYILQKINNNVFKNPHAIAFNISSIAHYLAEHFPNYTFITPIKTNLEEDIFFDDRYGYFRLMPFVENSYTYDTVKDPTTAYEAAKQFGLFTKYLSNFNANILKHTLPDFHNLTLRFNQFEESLKHTSKNKLNESKQLINEIYANEYILEVYESIKINNFFKIRVTHHDTKINNVLFDINGNGLCVIDLDTIMPGYFISDVGDMIRTYVCPVSEEETDFNKITIRNEVFQAVFKGYTNALQGELTNEEIQYFLYAGKYMIYMQAVRFLTDHLNNDVYYGAKYVGHNFIRTGNQLSLLKALCKEEDKLIKQIDNVMSSNEIN